MLIKKAQGMMGIIAVFLLTLLTACGGATETGAESESGAAAAEDAPADPTPTGQESAGQSTPDDADADAAAAGDYPDQQITVTIPVGPGGTIDSSTRLLSENWDLGVPFVHVNQPGAATELGARSVLQGGANGYNLLSTTHDLHVMMASVLSDEVDVDDFVPIGGGTMALEPALIVGNGTPWESAEEFVAALEEEQSDVTIAIVRGNALHIQTLQLLEQLGSDATVVPYASGGDARTSVAGGITDATIIPAAGYTGLAEDARILAVFADENPAPELTDDAPAWPDVSDVEVPFVEQVLAWYVPSEFAESNPAQYQVLVDTFAEAVQGEGFREAMAAVNFEPWIDYRTPDEIQALEQDMVAFVEEYGSLLTEDGG